MHQLFDEAYDGFRQDAEEKKELDERRSEEARRDHDRQIRSMSARLQQAQHANDEFLAIVSHELRTPLTTMIGWLHLLQMVEAGLSGTPEEREEHVTILRDGVRELNSACRTQARLIDELIDMSQITLGRFRVNTVPVKVCSLLKDLSNELRDSYEAKGVTLEIRSEGDGLVNGDPTRLRQVIWVLLFNAFKFTDRGGTVRVHCHRYRNMVRLQVKDTGRGIPVDQLPTIFDRLNKASGPPSSHGGGLGLGLSLAKTIVDLLGGSIYADSQGDGQGSEFTVLLPSWNPTEDVNETY